MKSFIRFSLIAVIASIVMQLNAQVATVAVSGAEVGRWTQDFDAAQKLAAERNLPVLVNFTGSDWCGWCKLMDKKVFAEEEWQNFAKDNVVLAYINFPQNKKLVPMHFVARNQQLAKKYGVRGYPTYIVLSPDGKSVWGQLGASIDANPKDFIEKFKAVIPKKDN